LASDSRLSYTHDGHLFNLKDAVVKKCFFNSFFHLPVTSFFQDDNTYSYELNGYSSPNKNDWLTHTISSKVNHILGCLGIRQVWSINVKTWHESLSISSWFWKQSWCEGMQDDSVEYFGDIQ
jgi:hypothetical protein